MPQPVQNLKLSTPAAFILVLVLSVFALAPLFYPGFVQTHSGLVPLWNIIDAQVGPLFGRWLPSIAMQFDPLTGDGLLFYYLAAISPFSPVVSVKLIAISSFLLGSAGIFLWLRSWLGNPGAVVAALVYVYLPYQLVTVYVRGAWGEVLFWGLLPWAVLAATFLVGLLPQKKSPAQITGGEAGTEDTRARQSKFFMKALAALGAIIFWLFLGLSQLGLALWAFLWLTALLLIVHFRQSWASILSAFLGLLGAGLVYVFLVGVVPPAPVNFFDHFLYPFQLFSSFWGFGISQPGWDDGLSLQIGLAGIGLMLLAVILWQRSATVSRTDRRLLFFSGAALALTLLTLGVARFVWAVPVWPGVTLADTLAYPWQLVGFIGLSVAILSGAALWLEPRLTQLPLFGAVILFVVLSSYSYLQPQFFQPGPYLESPPQAQLGNRQIALLDHSFAVQSAGNTAGLARGEIAVPLPLYGPLQANDVLRVEVVWNPLHAIPQNFKVFVHLVDPTGTVVAQYDGYPQSGDYPTTAWVPGELIQDSYPVLLPADAPPGPYQVYLGFYDEATLARLPVLNDNEGRVILNVE